MSSYFEENECVQGQPGDVLPATLVVPHWFLFSVQWGMGGQHLNHIKSGDKGKVWTTPIRYTPGDTCALLGMAKSLVSPCLVIASWALPDSQAAAYAVLPVFPHCLLGFAVFSERDSSPRGSCQGHQFRKLKVGGYKCLLRVRALSVQQWQQIPLELAQVQDRWVLWGPMKGSRNISVRVLEA